MPTTTLLPRSLRPANDTAASHPVPDPFEHALATDPRYSAFAELTLTVQAEALRRARQTMEGVPGGATDYPRFGLNGAVRWLEKQGHNAASQALDNAAVEVGGWPEP